ncbi:MAG TPA: tetratricopeptide repeat protein [Nitrospira sp.]|nr:tetratricopeptide repeat protein [Nitrospira sp.]
MRFLWSKDAKRNTRVDVRQPLFERMGRAVMCEGAMATGIVLVILACTGAAATSQSGTTPVPVFNNLGTHHYAISTRVPLAQRYFDQGLRLYYAFNHAEAIHAFEEAIRLDPDCAMCNWGLALAHGPNINAPMEREAALAAYDAIQKAIRQEAAASAKERALIRALAKRYAAEPPEDRSSLDGMYADALRDVTQRYPDDHEIATLFAEALMDLSPWNYWTADGKPRANTPQILAQLERVLAANPNHPGANHFYIHAVEAAQPERAVAAAERLATVMPGAGHVVHMPGHIYIRVGRYLDAIKANEHAVHADEVYIQDHRPKDGIYTLGYYPHNYDFLAFAASMIGRSRQTMTAAEKMRAAAPPNLLGEPSMTFLQHHDTRYLQMQVRFTQWQAILDASAPAEDLRHARAMWQYARGRALAARGSIKDSEEALRQVQKTAHSADVASRRLEFNTSGAILGIASEVLAGHIAEAKNDPTAAVAHLHEAARLEDALTYGEPPEWSVPVRQELGMMLLRLNRAAEAEQAFREDLKRFPDNGWSLHGLALALRHQERSEEADRVESRFKKMWASADVELPSISPKK